MVVLVRVILDMYPPCGYERGVTYNRDTCLSFLYLMTASAGYSDETVTHFWVIEDTNLRKGSL